MFTLTFSWSVENHARMQIIGAKSKQGYSRDDLDVMAHHAQARGFATELVALHDRATDALQPAYVLIIRGGASLAIEQRDQCECEHSDLLTELQSVPVDRQALVNKHARNACFADHDQPDLAHGRGTVINFARVPHINALREAIGQMHPHTGGMLAELNAYYDLTKCGIGYHGDKRREVIAVRVGAALPIYFQWFHRHQAVGPRIRIDLNDGDMYVMSDKAVGHDWRASSIFTLRHAVGG